MTDNPNRDGQLVRDLAEALQSILLTLLSDNPVRDEVSLASIKRARRLAGDALKKVREGMIP